MALDTYDGMMNALGLGPYKAPAYIPLFNTDTLDVGNGGIGSLASIQSTLQGPQGGNAGQGDQQPGGGAQSTGLQDVLGYLKKAKQAWDYGKKAYDLFSGDPTNSGMMPGSASDIFPSGTGIGEEAMGLTGAPASIYPPAAEMFPTGMGIGEEAMGVTGAAGAAASPSMYSGLSAATLADLSGAPIGALGAAAPALGIGGASMAGAGGVGGALGATAMEAGLASAYGGAAAAGGTSGALGAAAPALAFNPATLLAALPMALFMIGQKSIADSSNSEELAEKVGGTYNANLRNFGGIKGALDYASAVQPGGWDRDGEGGSWQLPDIVGNREWMGNLNDLRNLRANGPQGETMRLREIALNSVYPDWKTASGSDAEWNFDPSFGGKYQPDSVWYAPGGGGYTAPDFGSSGNAQGGVKRANSGPKRELFGEAGPETAIFLPDFMKAPGMQGKEREVIKALQHFLDVLQPAGRN